MNRLVLFWRGERKNKKMMKKKRRDEREEDEDRPLDDVASGRRDSCSGEQSPGFQSLLRGTSIRILRARRRL